MKKRKWSRRRTIIVESYSTFSHSKKVQYTMSRIPMIEEWLARYMMLLFVIIMEPWETFIGRTMR
jgi:hypothetical protein